MKAIHPLLFGNKEVFLMQTGARAEAVERWRVRPSGVPFPATGPILPTFSSIPIAFRAFVYRDRESSQCMYLENIEEF